MILEMGKGPIKWVNLRRARPGSLPGMATTVDKHLGRGYADLFLLLREELGLIPQGTLERREPSGRAGKGVAGVFNTLKLLAPGGGVGGDKAVKSCLQVLVGSLRLAVGLQVEPEGQAG